MSEEKKVNVRPLGNRVFVTRAPEQEKSKGGIIIPDVAKDKPQEGFVVSVGPGKVDDHGKLHEPKVKAGDKILFGKYSGQEIKVNGETRLILTEDDILGVIEDAS